MPLHRLAIDRSPVRRREQPLRARETILVRDGGGGVHAVHHEVRTVRGEPVMEQVLLERFDVRAAQQIVHELATRGRIGEHILARALGERHGMEDVPPERRDLRAARVRLQLAHRVLGLVAVEAGHDHALGGEIEQPTRHRAADEAAPAEDQRRRITKLHFSPVSARSRAP